MGLGRQWLEIFGLPLHYKIANQKTEIAAHIDR